MFDALPNVGQLECCSSTFANEVYKWVEFFSGSGMASKCMTKSGEPGCALDILHFEPPAGKPDQQNYLDMLTPSGMSNPSCRNE